MTMIILKEIIWVSVKEIFSHKKRKRRREEKDSVEKSFE